MDVLPAQTALNNQDFTLVPENVPGEVIEDDPIVSDQGESVESPPLREAAIAVDTLPAGKDANGNTESKREESHSNEAVQVDSIDTNSQNNSTDSCVEANDAIDNNSNLAEISKTNEIENVEDGQLTPGKAVDKVVEFLKGFTKTMPTPEQTLCPELNEEESKLLARIFGSGNAAVQFGRVHCTACNKHLGSALNNKEDRFVHPLLHVLVCHSCFDFYTSGEFEKDEDGSELYCRWCGQGGKVLCCAQCAFVFCTKCIKRNFGKKRYDSIANSDNWLCFVCDRQQTINLRVSCYAFFKYIEEEERRISLIAEPNPDLYTVDYCQCCKYKKRKWDEDDEFDVNEELLQKPVKRRKRPRSSTTTTTTTTTTEDDDAKPTSWEAQGDEEEVICAPDLLAYMDEDDRAADQPPPVVVTAPKVLTTIAPKLTTTCPPLIKCAFIPTDGTIQLIATSTVPPPLTTQPAVQTAKTVKLLNGTLTNLSSLSPPALTQIAQPSSNATTPQSSTSNVQDWFNVAAKLTANIQTNLTANIAVLGVDRKKAATVEEMANIHNRLQEVLSTSVNSLIQVRRNLRTNFLRSLGKINKGTLKKRKQPADDGDDVIFVKEAPSGSNVTETIDLSESNETEKKNSKPYLKVRSLEQLSNVPSECITIVDDEKESETIVEKASTSQLMENNDSNKENVDAFRKSPVPEKPTEEPELEEQLELTPEIKKALFESKLEIIVNENMKYNVKGIPPGELKKMLSVRVYPLKELKKKEEQVKVDETVEVVDFEEMLDRSVVRKRNALS